MLCNETPAGSKHDFVARTTPSSSYNANRTGVRRKKQKQIGIMYGLRICFLYVHTPVHDAQKTKTQDRQLSSQNLKRYEYSHRHGRAYHHPSR